MTDASFITVVSGLPRSGTSLMMQMLAAGGIPPLTDDERAADESNPKGYYELTRVRKLAADSTFLDAAAGHAVKIIHRLVTHLPERHHYRVILMRRPIEEVVASQRVMLERLTRPGARLAEDRLAVVLEQQLQQTRRVLVQQSFVQLLEVDYHAILTTPDRTIQAINHFLTGQLNTAAMKAVVDPRLYRQRRDAIAVCSSIPLASVHVPGTANDDEPAAGRQCV
ncbi:sulfotransferase family protein [Phycisphaerales bacterium AB-hyl4]|uniref:Sulfotransferase family protein n=1 Tax=Natronomicrosphaera hydrolytica TaxID=3242702 RepID=A0ABV4UBW9_9BACT